MCQAILWRAGKSRFADPSTDDPQIMSDRASQICDNVKRVHDQITHAAEVAGRSPGEIRLVAVTKYADPSDIRAVVAAGCTMLGESRPQVLWQRAAEFNLPDVQWHLIGHLQRNKVRRTLPLVALIHSVDSQRLLQLIDEESAAAGLTTPLLLEVNTSGEREKHGWQADELRRVMPTLGQYTHVRVGGLMTMAGREGGPQTSRRNFADLRTLRDELASHAPAGVELAELSMGMSRDFEAAIAEGATLVRVGSSLFEGLAQ